MALEATMMRRILAVLALVMCSAIVVVLALAGHKDRQVESLPDIEQVVHGLGSGMTVGEFSRRINLVGERDPNSSPHTATFRYNFDQFQIIVEAIGSSPNGRDEMKVEKVHLMHDQLTIEQRKQRRDEEWGRYVREHSGSR